MNESESSIEKKKKQHASNQDEERAREFFSDWWSMTCALQSVTRLLVPYWPIWFPSGDLFARVTRWISFEQGMCDLLACVEFDFWQRTTTRDGLFSSRVSLFTRDVLQRLLLEISIWFIDWCLKSICSSPLWSSTVMFCFLPITRLRDARNKSKCAWAGQSRHKNKNNNHKQGQSKDIRLDRIEQRRYHCSTLLWVVLFEKINNQRVMLF